MSPFGVRAERDSRSKAKARNEAAVKKAAAKFATQVEAHRVLRASAISAATCRAYAAALDDLKQYARRSGYSTAPKFIAETMEKFFWTRANQGYHPALGRASLYGWLHLECERPTIEANMLEGPRRALQGWSKLVMDRCRDPIPEELVALIAQHFVERDNPYLAAIVLLQTYLYARPSEIISLHAEDIILPGNGTARYRDAAVIFGASVRGLTTKTGEQDDTVILDKAVPSYLVCVLKELVRLAEGPRLFGRLATLSQYETTLKAATAELGLADFNIVPHTFRHSGPSNDVYHKRRTLREVQKRGRWKSTRSVARYEKAGRLLRRWAGATDKTKRRAHAATKKVKTDLLRALRQLQPLSA